ncbi:MAG: helix-turn-helix transcriptional regulator, partial [Christensenellaceae bacterium]|nr:helix-turn-helix transcriptional regulator [Christensenellaceae bacterium]
MNMSNLGKNILKLRKKQGLTQAELARRLNISDKAVSKWENG